ncbi:MAG: hypothetical protein AB7S48_12950 [Bacteroidales bacterium]
MRNYLIIISLSLLVANFSFAQHFVDLNKLGEGYFRIKSSSNKTIDGTSNLFEKWMNGSVKMIGVDEMNVDSLNFDTYSNNLLFQQKNVTYCVSDKHKLEYFTIGNSKFINLRSVNYPDTFFEVLSDGKVLKLVRLYKCIIVKGKESDGIDPGRNDKYKIVSDLFVIKEYGEVEPFKASRNDMFVLMQDKKADVEKYIKSNKLNLKRIENMANVFDYYNSLK